MKPHSNTRGKLFGGKCTVLNTLFPKGDEAHLMMSIAFDETVVARLVICSDWLIEDYEVWGYASNVLPNDMSYKFSILTKNQCKIDLGVDMFNGFGAASFFDIHNKEQFVRAVNIVVDNYEKTKEMVEQIEGPEEQGLLTTKLPLNGLDKIVDLDGGNTTIVKLTKGEYARDTDENMYQ